MHLTVEHSFPQTREALWPWLVLPERMNAWSLARVESRAPGDDDRPEGVGALRTIRVLAAGQRVAQLEEVIIASDYPSRFAYRVVRGPLTLDEHDGAIELETRDGVTHLRWTVSAQIAPRILEPVIAFHLKRQLKESLRRLEQVAAPIDYAPPPARSFKILDDVSDRLYLDARATLEAQRALATSLKGDGKYWFSRLYVFVTEEQLRHARSTHVEAPEWVLRIIPAFHRYYVQNLDHWIAGDQERTEAHWRRTFAVMDRAGDNPRETMRGMLLGAKAHIEEDLPRAFADVYLAHFHERASFARFRADFLSMGTLFERASQRLLGELPAHWLPPGLSIANRMLTPRARDALLNQRYDIRHARREAFERAMRLSVWKTTIPPRSE